MGMPRLCRLVKVWLGAVPPRGDIVSLIPWSDAETLADSEMGEASSREPRMSSPEYSSSSSPESGNEPSPPSSRPCVRLCL